MKTLRRIWMTIQFMAIMTYVSVRSKVRRLLGRNNPS